MFWVLFVFYFERRLSSTTFGFWNYIFSHIFCQQAELSSDFANKKAEAKQVNHQPHLCGTSNDVELVPTTGTRNSPLGKVFS